MRKQLLIIIMLIMSSISVSAQLSTPAVEAVYGGRILGITGYELSADSTRIFISTESANSIFYSQALTNTTSPDGESFTVLPAANADANLGSGIQLMAFHENSGYLFFAHPNQGLLKATVTSTSADQVFSGYVQDMFFVGDTLVYINANRLFTGTVDASGNYTPWVGDLIPGISPGQQKVVINPQTQIVYMFSEGSTPELMKTNDALSDLTTSTTFSTVSTSVSNTVNWKVFDIAPSGRYFMFGDDNQNKYVAYSDDSGSSWTEATIGTGVSGRNVAFSGDSASYAVFFAKLYNHSNGEGMWHEFGNSGFETHPNDGAVFADPHNANMVYMTTDQGIGLSVDGGSTIFGIDDGVEAVQVQDFDMTASKRHGWLAAKSGLRQVVNFLDAPEWSDAIYPNMDGSPYFSIEIDPSDSMYVYAGNVRVYQSTDDGANWMRVFTPEHAPYNFSNVGTVAEAIEVSPYDSNLVFAAYSQKDTLQGGLFFSADRGANWEQILIHASVEGADADVSDIVFTLEGSDTVAYVGAIYDLESPAGRSVYKLTKNGTSWTVSQDMNSTGTSTGSTIVASIWDLDLSMTGDTVFAVGTDAGINHPIAYYKDLNATNLWTPFTTSGFPFAEGKKATAASVGVDTLFVGVDNEVYAYKMGESAWTLGHSYPNGTEINMLYYDELLVGTGTGIYAHFNTGTTVSNEDELNIPTAVTLHQNYPNPFNPETQIQFDLKQQGLVKLSVYNILGQQVALLKNAPMMAGKHTVRFNASELSSGIYFYRLEVGNKILTKQMTLIK